MNSSYICTHVHVYVYEEFIAYIAHSLASTTKANTMLTMKSRIQQLLSLSGQKFDYKVCKSTYIEGFKFTSQSIEYTCTYSIVHTYGSYIVQGYRTDRSLGFEIILYNVYIYFWPPQSLWYLIITSCGYDNRLSSISRGNVYYRVINSK